MKSPTGNLYSYLRAALSYSRVFFSLAGLYGLFQTLRLFKLFFNAREKHSPINERIVSLARQLGTGEFVDGSSASPGTLYHDYALPEIQLKVHRKNSISRLSFLKKHLPVYKARVLDIGCGPGSISLGLALLGAAKVTGVDHDRTAIELAKAVAEKYDVKNTEFHACELADFDFPQADIVIWLSQWMWIVKQQGLEQGKDLLFEVSKKTGARVMAFESAADEGKAAIKGTTQKDIEQFLRSCTPFTSINNIGPFEDKWRKPGKERMVFICAKPELTWPGKEAVITRIDRKTVLKKYEPQRIWAKELEAQCLRRLAPFPYFPRLLEAGEDWIKMEWAGNRVTQSSELAQLDEIVQILASNGIVHRDICPENLLYRDGKLFLIDFGWAILDGKEPPATPGKNLGRGFYESGKWDDAMAAKKVRAVFEK
jgi:SAM-dependent methyltransferase